LKRWTVVDTNVLVSGVITPHPGSPPQRIVDAMLSGKLRFLVSEELVFEYRRALLYPRLVARHGLPETEVDALLEALLLNAGIREASAPTLAAGPETSESVSELRGDEHIIALLKAQPGAKLITGDRRLAEAVAGWCQVLTPAAFAATLD
jgi:predicted nucleic acid-binding protein